MRLANKYNTATMLWDNGGDQLDRATGKWRDLTAIDILMQAKAGVTNSLADSTTDANAATQFTSAYIFHQAGTAVTDISIPYLFNGNTLTSIKGPAGTLTSGKDYVVSSTNVTYKAAFLSKYLSASAAPGSKANLTLTFSAGAPLTANIVQYDTPVLASTSSAASAVPSGSDLNIPITWKGVESLAAVKGLMANGVGLVDSWTEYLGPLQQERMVSH